MRRRADFLTGNNRHEHISKGLNKGKEDKVRVGIATDHGGFSLKEDLVARLRAAGYEVVDFGAVALNEGDDYPDFVTPLARAVATGTVERGVGVCGSGVGASICANKIRGVRAALVEDHFSARQGVEDDHMLSDVLGIIAIRLATQIHCRIILKALPFPCIVP